GLNLVGNTAGTPEHLKSYVGLIAPDGSKINSSNYGIVGNNQQVYGEFLINNEKPLGDYKVDVKNAGVDAVGDVYVKVVDALTPLSPQLSFSTRTINGQSADNVMADEIGFTIGSNSSIKQLYNGDWRAQVFDTV
ncbi:hypothetical protein PG357_10525, partial [Riemerella anatipestifer]|nr:hypothetical protein [Riemerella anatipestifer]